MAKANPLKSEGSAQADGMLAVYEVTKILLGHGADGSVRRAYHRDTGTHRSRPRRTGQPLAGRLPCPWKGRRLFRCPEWTRATDQETATR